MYVYQQLCYFIVCADSSYHGYVSTAKHYFVYFCEKSKPCNGQYLQCFFNKNSCVRALYVERAIRRFSIPLQNMTIFVYQSTNNGEESVKLALYEHSKK